MGVREHLSVLLAGMLIGLFSAPVVAQSDNPANAGIQFDFSLPGARSLGLAGAFVGVADDATAAWANPAGLLALTKPEVSIEGRGWEFSNSAVVGGHAFGPPSGVGFDTVSGQTLGTFNSWTGAPSFISFVYPRRQFAVAVYRHQLQKFKASLQTNGTFIQTTSPTPVFSNGAIDRDQPFQSELEINVVNYGGAATVRLGGGVSAGVSLVVSDFSLKSHTDLFTYVPFNNFNAAVPPRNFVGVGQYYGPPDFSTSNLYTRTTESGNKKALAASAGLLWRKSDGRVSAGFAFRQGPTFDYQSQSVWGAGVRKLGTFAQEGDVLDTEDITYAVPNVYSVGVGFRPKNPLLVSVQYDRVGYSRLSANTAETFGVEEVAPAVGALIRRALFFPDNNQFRVGTEYALVASSATLALRFGIWTDPDHRMMFDRVNLTAQEQAMLDRLDVRYVPGKTAIHWTPGIGVALSRFQVDAAVDFSDPSKTVSVSTVVRF